LIIAIFFFSFKYSVIQLQLKNKKWRLLMNSISMTKKGTIAVTLLQTVLITFLMVSAAYIRIPLPFTPVPLTLQTFVVYLGIGILRKRAVFAQLAYLALGLFGLPVFTNAGSGFSYLLGPTGGYLVGFVAASILFGSMFQEPASFVKRAVRYSGAAITVYAFGVAGLLVFSRCSFLTAIQLGVAPFLAGEIIKLVLATTVVKK
jgi:biotin transport system substrate-specific component